MNLEFYLENRLVSLTLGKTNLFLYNIGGGKTSLCEMLLNGLSAKGDLKFTVNGINVDKSMFDVLYIDECFDFDEYLKFKVRGQMFKDFKKNFLDDFEEEFERSLLNFNNCLRGIDPNLYYEKLNNELEKTTLRVESGVSSIVDIYDSMFKLDYGSDKISYSEKIEVVIKHSLLYKDNTRVSIIIVDDFLCRIKKETVKSIVKLVSSLESVYVFFTSSVLKGGSSFDNIYLSNFQKVDMKQVYTYMFVYKNWDKNGDFNSFYDSHIRLVEESDLEICKMIFDEQENHITCFKSLDDFIKKCRSFLENPK